MIPFKYLGKSFEKSLVTVATVAAAAATNSNVNSSNSTNSSNDPFPNMGMGMGMMGSPDRLVKWDVLVVILCGGGDPFGEIFIHGAAAERHDAAATATITTAADATTGTSSTT
jgi:hypothetical protein